MDKFIKELQTLAGIDASKAVSKKEKLDEGVIGSIQEIKHVSANNDDLRKKEVMEDFNDLPADTSLSAEDIEPVLNKLKSGEITYAEFLKELEGIEMYYQSERAGEMGMYSTETGYDTHADHQAWEREKHEWDELDRYYDDYDDYDDELDESTGKKEKESIPDHVVAFAEDMMDIGMDPEQIVMSLASEFNLSDEEQSELHSMLVNTPISESLGEEMEFNISDYYIPALVNADETGLSDEDQAELDSFLSTLPAGHWLSTGDEEYDCTDDVTGKFSSRCIKMKFVPDQVAEDTHSVDADDYFPSGANYSVRDKVGPAGAQHGDNPMQKKMSVSENIHRDLKESYKKFLGK